MSTATVANIATGTKLVQARNVSKIFQRDAFKVTALDNVSIEIAGGDFIALMGPSLRQDDAAEHDCCHRPPHRG